MIAACCLLLAAVLRVKMHWLGQPYLPLVANTCCLIFFITDSLQQFHEQLEIMVRP